MRARQVQSRINKLKKLCIELDILHHIIDGKTKVLIYKSIPRRQVDRVFTKYNVYPKLDAISEGVSSYKIEFGSIIEYIEGLDIESKCALIASGKSTYEQEFRDVVFNDNREIELPLDITSVTRGKKKISSDSIVKEDEGSNLHKKLRKYARKEKKLYKVSLKKIVRTGDLEKRLKRLNKLSKSLNSSMSELVSLHSEIKSEIKAKTSRFNRVKGLIESTIRTSNDDLILRCLDNGVPRIDIQRELDVSRRQVDRVAKENGIGGVSNGKSLGETKVRTIFEDLFQCKFKSCRPHFLNGLELDGYNADLSIAFEYDGEQHYKYIPRFHESYRGFIKQVKRDRLKDKLCKELGITLIRIPYTVPFKGLGKHVEGILSPYLP